jgi:murein DD-endopeptidase MepM/ murein hydrolase activator NlpD
MNRTLRVTALAVLFAGGLTSAGWAVDLEEGRVAAERLLGCDNEAAQVQSYLPFTRQIGAGGAVSGWLAASTAAAGVPAAAMVEALKAFGAALDLDRDLHDGDHFYVRYEQTYTVEGQPIGIGRVLWAELRTVAKGTISIHRFRAAKTNADSFWLVNGQVNGQATAAPMLEMPLRTISVTSGFGLRADPMDQPAIHRIPMGPIGPAPVMPIRSSSGLKPSPLGEGPSAASPFGQAFGLGPSAWRPTTTPVAPSPSLSLSGPRSSAAWAMHEGVDLVAAPGTPILASGDGVVRGAEPRGRYGNWIEIEHDGTYGGLRLATVYGHLSAFAPGIAAGVHVSQGDLIGFTGTTGRTTGPHLHFEILANGRPGNPIGHLATRRAQLRGPDLERFKRQVARDLLERERDSKPM